MMKLQEFYEKAQQLRDEYKSYSFRGRAISTILLEVFNNEDKLPEKIEIRDDVGYEYRGKYVGQLEGVLKALKIDFDECWSYDGEKFVVRGARFK